MPSPGAQRSGDMSIGRGGRRGDIERDDLSAQIGDEDDFSEDIADSLGLGTVSDQDIAAALGGIAGGGRFGRGGGFIERSTRAQGGIGSGGRFGREGGLLDGGWDDDEAYEGEMMDASSGLLDVGNRSGFTGGGMMDYSDMTGLTEDDLAAEWGTGSTKRDAGYDYTGDMNLAMAHAYDQRFSDPNHAWNTLTENEKRRVVTREQAGPSWLADKFNMSLDSRLNNLINSEVGIRVSDEDRDDSTAIYACEASGGTWDGGSCVMPSDDNGDDNGEETEFGDADPFASLKRLEWTHPMLGYGQDTYSGTRPDYVSESIWDYKPPQLTDWTQRLKTWGGV